MKALVLDAGNTSSYHVMRSLGRKGHEAHLVASRLCHWHHSKYCGHSLFWPEDVDGDTPYFPFLADLLEEGRYDLLFFCGDAITEAIYAEFPRVSSLVECAAPGPRVGPIIFNKREAIRFVEELGVPVPKSYGMEELGALSAVSPGGPPFPLVVKGQKGSGSSNLRFVLNPDDLLPSIRTIQSMENESEPPSIQEYIGGPGFLVHLLFWRGELYAACCHRKDREYPIGGGVTAAATTVDIPELRDSAIRIARALDWHGLVKMDFVHDPMTREFKFIEIDPRVSASIDITRAAGVDQVAMLCDLAQGKDVKPMLSCQPGVKYRWLFPRDLLVGAASPGVIFGILPDLFRSHVHFDISPGDWWPFFYQVGRFVQERKYLDKGIREKARAARALRAAYDKRLLVVSSGLNTHAVEP